MVWRSDAQQGSEAAKVRFDLVRYMAGTVLDLGCGPAKIFPAKNIIGVDNDVDAKLFGIKANPNIYADATKRLPFEDGYADTIFSSHLLEHAEDYKATLKEWWRVLKVGGYLILYLPHADWYPNIGMPHANVDHKHDFRNDDITHAMRECAWRSGKGWEQLADEVRCGGNEYSFLQIYRKLDSHVTQTYDPPEKPEKTLAVVRLGAHGDALWLSAILPGLKEQGWHVTVYTQEAGEASLRHDPNIDCLMVQQNGLFGDDPFLMQIAYWQHEEGKYDKFVNLTGCVERDLLPHPYEFRFHMPFEQRHALMNRNYMEALHEWCGVPFDRKKVRVRFYPTAEELAWAAQERAKHDGALVMINPTGSTLPKFWPHTQRLMELLDAQGVSTVMVGDKRLQQIEPPALGKVVGTDWDIRRVFTLAQMCDVVVGTESAVVNSVAHNDNAKIVLLSHSSGENLTRDWQNTVAFSPVDLACYPCHRIHADATYCTVTASGNAACQEAATPEVVAECVLQWIGGKMKEAA